jgi:uncharacterized protein (TIGR03435 family)
MDRRKNRVTGLAAAIASLLAGAGLYAADERPSFDVASVRIHADTDGPRTTIMNDEPNGLHYTNVALRSCIPAAWGIRADQLEGVEPRAPERYDIEAKSGHPVTRETLMPMLRTLLEDRFQLKFHETPKVMPVYRLNVTKGGPRLHEAAAGDAETGFSGGRSPHLEARMSMERFAEFLSGYTDRPVIDGTALTGMFAFTVNWSVGNSPSETEDSLFGAVEKLGMKPDPATAAVQVLVVDHVNRIPGEN